MEPASWIAFAMIVTLSGGLITAAEPDHMVLRSSVAMSGLSSTMCSTRLSGGMRVEPGPATRGSSLLGTKRPPGPVVRLMIKSEFLSRMRSTTSR